MFPIIINVVSWVLVGPQIIFGFNYMPWLRAVKGSLQKEKRAVWMRKTVWFAFFFWPSCVTYYMIEFAVKQDGLFVVFAVLASLLFWLDFKRYKKFIDEDDNINKWKKKLKRFIKNTFTVQKLAPLNVKG